MFCINCGVELPNGSKFCSECGTNLMALKNSGEVDNDDIQSISQSQITNYKKEIIVDIFNSVFNDSRLFGDQVYIIGKNPISREIKEKLENYYLDGQNEKPLLVFNYRKALENGMVITDQRLIWYFGTKGRQSVKLEDIKNVTKEKAFLATIMKVVDFDNVEYPEIYLDGIQYMNIFVEKFSEFVDNIFSEFYDDEEDDDDQYDSNDIENSDDDKYFVSEQDLWEICRSEEVGAPYCEVGNPLKSKKEKAARVNFDIPQNEKIFLLYDSTVFGSCKHGFAICLSGIYFNKEGMGNGIIEWDAFKHIKINGSKSSIDFEGISFNTGSDGKKLLAILLKLQGL